MLRQVSGLIVVFMTILLLPVTAFAQTASTHYSVTQTLFGVGGNQNLNSTNYTSSASVGDLGVGNYTSNDYQAYAGFNTTADPYIQFVVTAQNLNLGILSTGSTATAVATFYVRVWDSSGYIVRTESVPPTDGSHAMTTSATAGTSTMGTEQFGMNLVSNTSPVTQGANPVDGVTTVPSCVSTAQGGAFGQYDIANNYAYNIGDEVAYCNRSSSSTIYTVSYIFNISKNTPAGQYNFDQILVATGDY